MPYDNSLLGEYRVLQDPNDSLHRTVNDIVASYNSPWDPLTELIQNAVDAINQRAALADPGFVGKIFITVDSTNSSLTVEDNGSGIPSDIEGTLLLPGGSLKRQGNTFGHKGLGFSYCAHVTDHIEVETEHNESGDKDHWKFSNGFHWLCDPTNDASIEKISNGSIRTLSGPGSTVKMTFMVGQYEPSIANTAVLDTFFDWADDEKLLTFVLRTRTAVGQVSSLFGNPLPTDIEVYVHFVNGNKDAKVNYRFFEFDQLPPFNQQTPSRADDYATNIFLNPKVPNKTHFGIQKLFSTDQQNPSQPLRVGRHKGGVKFSASVFVCGKKNLSEALGHYDSRLTSNFSYLSLTTDVHLAIDGMPCGVPIDSWNNFGSHEQRYFCIINAELSFGTVLDAGRKTITRHYVDLLVNKIIEMTKDKGYFSGLASLYDLSQQLHSTAPLPPTRSPIDYIRRWQNYTPLAAKSLLLLKRPDDELGVYLLFAELVGRGLLPGYQFEYVSGAAVYDAAAKFQLNLGDSSNLNSSANGQTLFGVGSALLQRIGAIQFVWQDSATGRNFLILEFKVNVEDLLRDVQNRKSEKRVGDIDVLICVGFDQQAVNNLGGALLTVNEAGRELSGVTHKLGYAGHEIQVIVLGDVITTLTAAQVLA